MILFNAYSRADVGINYKSTDNNIFYYYYSDLFNSKSLFFMLNQFSFLHCSICISFSNSVVFGTSLFYMMDVPSKRTREKQTFGVYLCVIYFVFTM